MLIDTFLFSEPHESDLLYLKMLLEQSVVGIWIIQENAYTTQGDYKGLFAQKVMEEERFAPFRDRTIICSANDRLGDSKSEGDNFQRENLQRTLCVHALRQLQVLQEDLIMVSDVDEMIDFSSDKRTERFLKIMAQHPKTTVYIGRMRYWFDYDNRAYISSISIPVLPVSLIAQDPYILTRVRHVQNGPVYEAGEDPIAFEYSYVYKNIEDVWRKKCTYAHTGFTYESVEIALECNHWPRAAERGEFVGTGSNYSDWFERVELTPQNSPKYVRENIEQLRTNIVDKNYKQNRERRYGHA